MSRRIFWRDPFRQLLLAAAVAAIAGCSSPANRTVSPSPAVTAATPIATQLGSLPPPSPLAAPTQASTVWPATRPRDVYVLISGGGTPLSNNYSQYLQAKAIAAFFERTAPADSTWVFFGAGNRDDAPPVLADAHRETAHNGLLVPSWVPGVLKRNRAATRENILRALREEILPAVHDGGTLYLFIGDHGELAGPRDQRESAITLWELKHRATGSGWFTDNKEVLGVAELRQILAAGLGRGRVVFCMTQCHGGGFHELGVAREMTPSSDWFTAAPDWAAPAIMAPRVRAAGFTATDEASLAAGCDPDPDPGKWAGYERYLPEKLFGLDLISGARVGEGTVSFAAAHEAATLVDDTIDKPRATSEHYLAAWAQLIETRLASAAGLTAQTKAAVAAYRRAVDTGEFQPVDARLNERAAQFRRFTAQLVAHAPAAKTVLLSGTRAQLEQTIAARGERGGGGRGNRRGAMTELRRLWTETLRPAWKTAVLAGQVADLTPAQLAFEKRLLTLEDGGRNFMLPRGEDDTPLLNEIYWRSSYAEPATFNREKAEAVARWGGERKHRIVAWAADSSNAQVRAAGEKIGATLTPTVEPPRTLSGRTAAERVLFYRRVLAAWQFLLAMNAEPALAELNALIELERTPLAGAK